MRLKGKRALVTGASRGLGRGIALALAAEGASVLVAAENPDELEDARLQVAMTGAQVKAVCVDLRERREVNNLSVALRAEGQRLDILVNGAGVLHISPLRDMTDETWDETIAVNLTAPFLLMKGLWPLLAKRGGAVINVSSRAGVEPLVDQTAFCAAQFGIEGLTRAGALEWRESGVSVNTMTPGTPIKPTGTTDRGFSEMAAAERAQFQDPLVLGPAFVMLASLVGTPTGLRFDARKLTDAITVRGFDAVAAELVDYAEPELAFSDRPSS